VPTQPLSLPLLSRTGGGNQIEKLVGQDKDREIAHQSPSWAKQTQLGEFDLILLPINNKEG